MKSFYLILMALVGHGRITCKKGIATAVFAVVVFCSITPFNGIYAQLPGLPEGGYLNCLGQPGCTDPTNSGIQSTVPVSLSYDNVISAWHSSAAQWVDGGIKVWGEYTGPVGNSNSNPLLIPTSVNPGNGFNYTGDPVMIAIASNWNRPQFVLLTSNDELWAWGFKGVIVASSLTPSGNNSNRDFQKMSVGLPQGVTSFDVKMLFGTVQTLALTTCNGDVYVLSQNDLINQGGGSTNWVRIKKSSANNDYLTNVVATRGTSAGLIALDVNGDIWTWGYGTRLGDGSSSANITYATKMTKPKSGTIKMIGAMKQAQSYNNYAISYSVSSNISYYVLYTDGALYALGGNATGQLGDFSTTNRDSWIQPRYSSNSSDVMNDIVWISPQEHSYNEYPSINVISGKNNGEIWNWGQESGYDLGRNTQSSTTSGTNVNPGKPTDFSTGNNSDIITVESGGHTTVLLRKCDNTFGYIGHKVNGSMGDNSTSDATINKVQFESNVIDVCGLPTTNGTLQPTLETPNNTFFNNNPIQLTGSPAGGGYAIVDIDGQPYGNNHHGITIDQSGLLDATGANFPTSGIRSVRISYIIPNGEECAGASVQLVLTIKQGQDYVITIPGQIWGDVNEDAVINGTETNFENNNLWANLTDPNGVIIARTKVNPDGTYAINTNSTMLIGTGDYHVILTNSQKGLGNNLTGGDEPGNGIYYTGTNRGNAATAHTDNTGGVINLGDLSMYASSTGDDETDPANFGVSSTIRPKDDINQIPVNTLVDGDILINDKGVLPFDITEAGGAVPQPNGDIVINNLPGKDKDGNQISGGVGNIVIHPDGSYTFTPNTDYVGVVDPIPYTVKDPVGNEGNAILNIKVIPNNTPNSNSIIAQDDYATTTEGVGIGNSANPTDLVNPYLFNNDSDPQGDSFIVTGVTNGGTPSNGVWSFTVSGTDLDGNPVPNAGTVTIEEEGRYTFVPNANFTGTIDPIEYQICDDAPPIAACDEATLNINVIPRTNKPDENYTFANDDANSGKMGELQAGNVLGNDTDPEGDNQSVTGFTYMDWDGSLHTATPGSEVIIYVTDPDNAGQTIIAGSLKIDANGYYEYSPDRDFTGTVVVPYSIVDDNTNPATAQATLYLTTVGFNSTDAVEDINNTWINTPVVGNVMTNDFDREGDNQVFESFLSQDGNHTPIATGATVSGVDRDGNPVADAGTLTFGSDGSYTFTPSTDFVGTVTVPYRIHDDADNAATDIANLVITVSPNAVETNSVIANNDTYYTLVNIPVAGNNFGNDSDPQDDGFTVTAVAQSGTSIPVGTATTVSGITERGDVVADAGQLTQNADGTMEFVPSQGFAGTVTYTYTITDDHTSGDGVASDQAQVTIQVSDNNSGPRNDSDNFPFAGDDFVITTTNTPVDGNFIDNDFVPNGKSIFLNGERIDPETPDNTVIQTLTTVEGGTVEMHQDGTFTYTPATGYNGPDRVVYEVCDFTEVGPFCAQATIYMLVSPNRVLPIMLIDFAANRNGNVANLTWTTVTESNNAGFDVQRSTDGQSWQSIGHVASKATNGNSNAQLNYRFVDNNPVTGVNYYRLHQQDLDGNNSLSEVRIVNFGDNSDAIVIYPNPVRTTAIVRGLTGNETLRVYDANGRVVRSEKATGNQTTIDLSGLAQGTYRVQVVSADGRLVKTLSVVKAR